VGQGQGIVKGNSGFEKMEGVNGTTHWELRDFLQKRRKEKGWG